MSKKRNTSTGQSAETKVDTVVNRFNLLNEFADDNDSDTEEIQPTKRVVKNAKETVDDVESGSDNDDKPINNSKKASAKAPALVDEDGFQTVRANKTRKPKQAPQPVEVEKSKPRVKKTQEKEVSGSTSTSGRVRAKQEPEASVPDKQVDKQVDKPVERRMVRRVAKDIPHDEDEEVHQKENLDAESQVDKKALYVPPVPTDGWTMAQPRRRRFDRSERAERSEPVEEIEDTDANKIEYYNPGIKLHGDEMKLNTAWTVWIHENDNQDWSLSSYKSIYEINSIGSMWRFLWILDNLNKNVRQYYIMRNGITPIWEDNNNKQGAICSIMIDNMNRSSRHTRGDLGVDAFSAICILAMNESFVKNNQDINGLCYSIKSRSVLIKLWIKDYESNSNFIDKLPITILKSLDTIISNMENRGHLMKSNGKSKVSVQIKQIKPNY